jgi:hypothetical protein
LGGGFLISQKFGEREERGKKERRERGEKEAKGDAIKVGGLF